MSLLDTSAPIPLSNLPLRPSTLDVLLQRGFNTTSEVAKSRRDGGLANLAAELGCSLRQATDYVREIQGCLSTIMTTPSQRYNNNNNGCSGRGGDGGVGVAEVDGSGHGYNPTNNGITNSQVSKYDTRIDFSWGLHVWNFSWTGLTKHNPMTESSILFLFFVGID